MGSDELACELHGLRQAGVVLDLNCALRCFVHGPGAFARFLTQAVMRVAAETAPSGERLHLGRCHLHLSSCQREDRCLSVSVFVPVPVSVPVSVPVPVPVPVSVSMSVSVS
eukprot:9005375-Alexandrium_andersonii.AAC.1